MSQICRIEYKFIYLLKSLGYDQGCHTQLCSLFKAQGSPIRVWGTKIQYLRMPMVLNGICPEEEQTALFQAKALAPFQAVHTES